MLALDLQQRSSSVVLVVCPLIAIMEDQVKDAVRRGPLAAYILCDTTLQTKRSLKVGVSWYSLDQKCY